MIAGQSTRLFFDASVLIAGARSPTGGSARILESCRLGRFDGVISQAVLIEVSRNLERFTEAYGRFRYHLATIAWDLVPTPNDEAIRMYESLIHPKDAHVLTAALTNRCHFLLTLDRRDFFTVRLQEAGLPLVIVTPGDFLQRYYPLHPNYPSEPRG